MKIDVNWLGNDFHFEAENDTNGKIRIDGNNEIGELEGGLAPMQLLLAGVGGCSAIDVLHILEKQKQKGEGATHTEYRSIHLHFIISGELDPKKVERALKLSITKYCSASKALEKGSDITYDYKIV